MAFRPVALVCAENASDEHVDQLPTTPAGSNKLKIDMTPNGGGARRKRNAKNGSKNGSCSVRFREKRLENGSKRKKRTENAAIFLKLNARFNDALHAGLQIKYMERYIMSVACCAHAGPLCMSVRADLAPPPPPPSCDGIDAIRFTVTETASAAPAALRQLAVY